MDSALMESPSNKWGRSLPHSSRITRPTEIGVWECPPHFHKGAELWKRPGGDETWMLEDEQKDRERGGVSIYL